MVLLRSLYSARSFYMSPFDRRGPPLPKSRLEGAPFRPPEGVKWTPIDGIDDVVDADGYKDGIRWEPIGDIPQEEVRRHGADRAKRTYDLFRNVAPGRPIEDVTNRTMRSIVDTVRLDLHSLDRVGEASTPGKTLVKRRRTNFYHTSGPVVHKFSAESASPVTQVRTETNKEGAFLMPDPAGDGVKAEHCQDRAAFAYIEDEGGNPQLRAFALGDGVSQSMTGAGTADVYTRYAAASLAEAADNGIPLDRYTAPMLCQALGKRIHALNPREQVLDDYYEASQRLNVHSMFRETREEIAQRRDGELGSTTLLAGQITRHPGGEMKVDLMSLGDCWHGVIRADESYYIVPGNKGVHRAPAQLCVGMSEQRLTDLETDRLILKKGDVFIAGSDGLEAQVQTNMKNVLKELNNRSGGYTAIDVARLLMLYGASLDGRVPQSYDDRSIVAIQA